MTIGKFSTGTGYPAGRAMLCAVLLASVSALPALAQTARTNTNNANDTALFLRGTTDEDTGTDGLYTGNNPATPSQRPELDSGSSSDPLVPSYADTLTSEQDNTGLYSDQEREDPSMGRALRADRQAALSDNAPDYGRINTPEASVDGLNYQRPENAGEPQGIRLGTMILRPTLTQRIVHESTKSGSTSTSRTYSETVVEGSLETDWSRHKLTINGAATLQKNLSGKGQEEPTANIEAILDLDLSEQTSAQLRAGYDFSREDRTDPNYISNATTQATVHQFTTSAALTRQFGKLRGTVTGELGRTIYGDATLPGGTLISGSDRDTVSYGLKARAGYEVSPALIPFLEASYKRTTFDQECDSGCYYRSATDYGLKAGAELPFSEKLTGEVAVGYVTRKLDDPRLADIDALALEGSLAWSPVRGTTLRTTLSTGLESSTTPGESGSVSRQIAVTLEHELRNSVVARLSGSFLKRNFEGPLGIADETVMGVNGELDWSINRNLSLVANAGFERTSQGSAPDSDTMTIGLGLRLKR